MGWKGALRSYRAAVRRAEREAQRAQRQQKRELARLRKQAEHERVATEVQEFEEYIERLVTLHHEASDPWDWAAIRASPSPTKPVKNTNRTEAARRRLEDWKPGVFTRLFRRVEAKRQQLVDGVDRAEALDEADYESAVHQYKADLADWEELQALASRVLEGDQDAYLEVIRGYNPFAELEGLGSKLDVKAKRGSPLMVTVHVNTKQVVPSERKTQLKSGKLSVKSMPKTRYYALYQDHVCSCALRVACELFALLPVEIIVVTAVTELLNTSTGHLEEQPILSVAFARETLEKLRFETLDPSDAMINFVHNMDFKKTKGFTAIDPIEPEDLAPPEDV